jgi:hypothetical protein
MSQKTLRPAQIGDLSAAIAAPRVLFAHDPGVGKTPPACMLLWWYWSSRGEKSFWIQPKSLFGKNKQELLDWTHFKDEDVLILDAIPPEVQKLKLIAAARAGCLALVTKADVKMVTVLDCARRGTLIFEETEVRKAGKLVPTRRYWVPGGKVDQNAVKKAVKAGWIEGTGKMVLTEGGAVQLKAGLLMDNYQIGKEPVGRALVDAMIADQSLKIDEQGHVTIGQITRDIQWICNLRIKAKVVICGFDFFSENWAWLLELNDDFNVAAVDEIHLGYGENDSKRTQQFYMAMQKLRAFVPMTGTLINGKLTTAYPVIKLIEPRYYANYDDFKLQHEEKDEDGKRIGWKNHGKITTILSRIGRRRSFEEEYGPMAKVILPEWVEMSPIMRENYDKFHAEAMLELEDRFLDGSMPGVATIRARQIMQCPEIFGLCKGESSGKDERLKVYLGDCQNDNEPFAIFSVYPAEHDRLANLVADMDMRVDVINGSVSGTNRVRIDKAFQARELDVVIASEATAGIGFNWGHLNRLAYASCDYQDGNFGQAYKRGIRGKRERPLLAYVLGYLDSVDIRVFSIIDSKSRDANLVDPTREIFKLSQRVA